MSREPAVRVPLTTRLPAAPDAPRFVTAAEADLQRRVAVLETEVAALREHDRRQSEKIARIERVLSATPGPRE